MTVTMKSWDQEYFQEPLGSWELHSWGLTCSWELVRNTQQVYKLFYYILDVKFISLYTSYTRNQYSEKYNQFNNTSQTKTICFITSVRTFSISTNLQLNYSNLLFSKNPTKANNTFQYIRRIQRLSQLREGCVYRIIVYRTYNMINTTRTNVKFYTQLASTYNILITHK